ncbi:glutamate synthase [NADH] [Boothiomyces sp. JEL0838]|nr:glutamate synthase [NADH] [Boothiomyces sp. JEL0838]
MSEETYWADTLPKNQGLYNPELEKDACGVGFICHIKGDRRHDLVRDARGILCNMTHRGATGADIRDGDGAGVMSSIPHELLKKEVQNLFGITIPPRGEYAVGNIFFNPAEPILEESKSQFEEIARDLGLLVLCWRRVPVQSSILGPVSKSKEPVILQPFVILAKSRLTTDKGSATTPSTFVFDQDMFERQLYLLRKNATRVIGLSKWFYICSLQTKNIVYKGQLSPVQVYDYFDDLRNMAYKSHFCLVHSRFSTNTFPSWDRAQPMRLCAHNGEINTLRGNKNWMRAREGVMKSAKFDSQLESLYPIVELGGSDSAAFDNVLELLVMNGALSLPEAVMMMIPEAWQNQINMEPEKRAFYEWASCLMEPWDGPALFTFSDGRFVGASLDRNGLRPCRFYITSEDMMICASEVGTIPVATETIVSKGRLQPGKMLLVDTKEGRIVDDRELKMKICSSRPFGQWIEDNMLTMTNIKDWMAKNGHTRRHILDSKTLTEDRRMIAFGYTLEQLTILIVPMIQDGKEALGSMGTDTPLACLSQNPRLIYDYFRQLFAQVTNPPIDPIREEIVMSLTCYIGPQGNILEVDQSQCRRLRLPSPILSIEELNCIKDLQKIEPLWSVANIDITFPKTLGASGYTAALDLVCAKVSEAIHEGYKIAVLSDTNVSSDRIALSAAVALGAVHHHLVRNKQRSKIALIIETGEAREVHHFCVLLGYGADAICPYLAFESVLKLNREGLLKQQMKDEQIIYNFIKASNDGIKKVMSKMGISTLQSYKGAQVFEALGIDMPVINKCFFGTASRIKGVGFQILAMDAIAFHELAWPSRQTVALPVLPESGDFHWRSGGEQHINDPVSIANLQDAVRRENQSAYDKYSIQAFEQIKNCTLRGMLDFDFDNAKPIPIDEVEPWTNIVKRFCTGAMSYGSISLESHTTLAKAMNRLGGKSNTGEGGENPDRSIPKENGDSERSAIKQVASGRFGVTSYYLSDADELQIKLAQGAKPGEGGELPGYKVTEGIAATRKSTPGVGLISPPPHHDIYSIEDLKQLIYDLKCANTDSRVSVKLVSEVGVGIIASGVAKAKADHILISGHDGGTGASRWTGIKYAGLPWELGLAETHQTLVLNDLRGRIVLQTDGQIKTGRDVAIACLLGAEEWGFATTPLIVMGCTMMRKCHLNTCPVGIATQDPELRKKFVGTPEHVVNFFHYVAEECRSIMAKLGFRSIDQMVGRTDLLKVNDSLRNPKTKNLDLTPILTPAFTLRPGADTYNVRKQDHLLHKRIDNKFIAEAEPSLKSKQRTVISSNVTNTDRTVGTTLSYQVSKLFGEQGLPTDTIHINLTGSAGQSLGAFLAPGITIELEGDCNDYVGKGLSGGTIIVYPPKNARFMAETNILVGNVCLYGATSGKAFIRGVAAERFAVRNSGATAVVEGCGDHGCEYMTGGRVIILGTTGRNFAAGMSGGIAYVLDLNSEFKPKCNTEMVDLETVNNPEEIAWLLATIDEHRHFTGSSIADRCLKNWSRVLTKFVKVMPRDYKAALLKLQKPASPVQVKPKVSHEPALLDIEDGAVDQALAIKKNDPIDKVRGFVKYKRQGDSYRNKLARTKDWKEVNQRLTPKELKVQAARCMDCGVPFCQSDSGCPIGNIIPKWNDLVFKNQWKDALDRLLMTNNFPEFTGRVCPAPCEGACVLGINELPVSIKSIECAIIDRAFEEGWIVPNPPTFRTGKTVSIIGSGPAGLAAADQLNKAGHHVVVYDRNDRHGGLLMYGIPNMKLDKQVVQRRIDLMAAEGVEFVSNAYVGKNVDVHELKKNSDILLLATGATWPRDLGIPNRNLDGIHFAMEFLQKNTKSLLDSELQDEKYMSAKGKKVIVIGAGDTATDCIGTSVRHGCKSVLNFELLPAPPATRAIDNPWPQFPRVFKVDYGHAEATTVFGKDPRHYQILTKEFVSDGKGNVKGINTVRVDWSKNDQGSWTMKEVPGTEEFFEADLVLLAMGFLGPEKDIIAQLELKQDMRSNVETPRGSYKTSVEGVFAAGDCRRGASLIVWGINEGRQAAREIDIHLSGNTRLPVTGGIEKRLLSSMVPPQKAVLAQETCSKDSDCGQQNGCYKNYCISTDTSCDLFPKGCLSGFQCFGSICGLSPGCKKDSDCLDNAFACVSTQCILRSQRCDLFNSCLSGFTCIGRACVMGTGGGLNGGSGSSNNGGAPNGGNSISNGGSSTSNPTPAPSVNTNSGSNSPSGSSNSPNTSSYPSITADNSSSGSSSTSSIDKGLLVAIVCGAIVAFLTVILFVKLKERNQKKAQAAKDAKLMEQQSNYSSTQSPYSQTTLLQNVTPMSQQTVPTFHSAPSSQMSSSNQSPGEMWGNQSYPTNQMVQPTWNQQSLPEVPVNQSRFGIPSNTGNLPLDHAMYRQDHISNREEGMLPVLNPVYIEKPPVEQHFPPIIMQSTENAQFIPQQDIHLPNAMPPVISHGGADQEMPPVMNFSVPITAQHEDNRQRYSNAMPPLLDK